jgi:hypothetical protein
MTGMDAIEITLGGSRRPDGAPYTATVDAGDHDRVRMCRWHVARVGNQRLEEIAAGSSLWSA